MDIILRRKGNNGMNTIKYELKKNSKEISYSDRMEIMQGCTLNQEDQEPEIIKSFDNKDDALLELRNYLLIVSQKVNRRTGSIENGKEVLDYGK